MKYLQKDITTIDKGIIAHGVNCQGQMGAGVALALLRKWPAVYETYIKQPTGASMLGMVSIITVDPSSQIYVVNCYTQEYFGPGDKRYASPDAIKRSLTYVYELAYMLKLDVYLPKIGAGLGGLDWDTEVEPIISELDSQHDDVETYICAID